MNPTVAMLQRLIGAAGSELLLSERSRHQSSPTIEALRRHRAEIEHIMAVHGARNIRVFGSVARGDAQITSDVDLLIDLPEGASLVTLGQIEDELDDLLSWQVDVISSGAVRGRLTHILDEAVPL